MAYIDKTYYDNDYKGSPIEDVTEFERTAERASEVIDKLTNYSIANYEFTNLATFIQNQVKKATAAQVEFYALNGGYESTQASEMSSVAIGSFNYSEGTSGDKETSDNVISHLIPTGLLYRGLGVYHGC